MSVLPKFTSLGNLEIIEVYEYYDKPCLFSCQNEIGQIFLAVWVDETADCDLWLYVPMSPKRLQYVQSGGIDLRDAFLTAEDGFVFRVLIDNKGNSSNVITIPSEEIKEDWLPIAGEFLDCNTQTLEALRN